MWDGINNGSVRWQYDLQLYFHRPEFELYDTVADPLELHNLALESAASAQLAKMQSELHRWLTETADQYGSHCRAKGGAPPTPEHPGWDQRCTY